jgi:hypothetical protein
MEGQIETPEVPFVAENGRCDAGACNEPATADLDAHSLCLQHFVSVSMRELDSRSENVKGQSFDTVAVNDFKHFLADCEKEATRLSETEQAEDSPAKPRILEVLRRVSQLSRGLRRSPRFTASVPVWLRREDPSRTWEEETWTSSVSRYGAGFACHHAVDIGGEVVLCRRDKGNRVRARVVYCRFDNEGRRQIGVELLDQIDFWDLEKMSAGAASCGSPQ